MADYPGADGSPDDSKFADAGVDYEESEEIFGGLPKGLQFVGNEVDIVERLLMNIRYQVAGEYDLSEADSQFIQQFEDNPDEPLDYVFQATLTNIAHIFKAKNSGQEIEWIFDMVVFLIRLLQENKPDVEKEIMDVIAVQDKSFADTKLKICTAIFNQLSEKHPEEARLFDVLLSVALETGSGVKLVRRRLETVPDWLKRKECTPEVRRSIFMHLYQLCASDSDRHYRRFEQRYLLRYLNTFSTSENMGEELFKLGSQAIVTAIKNAQEDTLSVMELFKCAVTKRMRSMAEFTSLCELLDVFYKGQVADFNKCWAKNCKEFTEKWNLSQENLNNSMQMLTLCSIGNEQETISMEQLREKLQLAENGQVEELVINCVMEGLVEGTIDHSSMEVRITRSTQRQFDAQRWKDIEKKLHLWQENLNAVVGVLDQNLEGLRRMQVRFEDS